MSDQVQKYLLVPFLELERCGSHVILTLWIFTSNTFNTFDYASIYYIKKKKVYHASVWYVFGRFYDENHLYDKR